MSKTQPADPMTVLFGVNGGTKAVFFRQLATMVHSGLPVGRAVKTASELGLRQVGTSLAQLIEKDGCTLSEAMAKHPHHFSRYEIALVRAGEKSGQLDRQLEELAKSAETSYQMHKKITSMLVYPVVVAHSVVFLPPLFLLVTQGLAAYLKTVLAIIIPAYLVVGTVMVTYRLCKQTGGPHHGQPSLHHPDNLWTGQTWVPDPILEHPVESNRGRFPAQSGCAAGRRFL